MKKQLRVLIIEDSEDDAELLARKLKHGSYDAQWRRVDTQRALVGALDEQEWDIVLCDYRMPGFSGLTALKVVKERELDIPFIFVSGTIGEDTAVEAMKMGAHDYVMKDNLKRLLPAIERELKEASVRRERKRAENALTESEKKYRDLVNNALVGVYTTNLQGDILYVNRAMSRMFEFGSPEEMMSESILKRYKSLADRGRFLESLRNTGSIDGFEVELVTRTGRTKNVVISATLEGDFLSGMIMDITERKRAEEELRESERRYQTLAEISPVGIFRTDARGRTTYVNRRWCEIAGLASTDAMGYGWLAAIHPQDRESIARGWKEATQAQGGAKAEYRFMRPDGSITWVIGQAISEKNDEGQVIGYIGTLTDITERMQAEEKIRQSESQFRMVWESSIDGMRLTDEQGTVLRVNDAFCRMVGKTREEMEGKSLSAIYSEEQRDHVHRRHQERFRSGTVKPHFEQELTLWDGRKIWLEVSNSFFQTGHQSPLLLSIFRDITERKQAEERLRLLAHTIRSVSDCVRVTDTEDRLIFVNDAFLKTYGYSEVEVLGRHINLVRSPNNDPALLAAIHPETLAGGWQGELLNRRKDETEFPIHLSSSVVRDERGEVVAMVGIVRDITERKLAQQRLERERNLLRTIIEAIPDEIAVKDTERRFIVANPATVRALKASSVQQVLGKRDEDLIPKEHALDGRLEEEKVFATGLPFVNKEGKTRINPKTGEIERSILISKIPLRDRDGKIMGLVVVNRDITKRKKAEVEVQRSRDWLNAILDASRDGIGVEKSEVLVYANEAFARIFGYDDPRELIGKHASVVLDELETRRMMEYGRKRLSGEQVPEVYEFRGKRRDGKYADLEASVSSASIAGEEHIIATFRDITERKSLQKQLIEAQKMESIGTLAGGIAHDFNNILGIIMGHASILEMVQTTPERLAQSTQAISKATHRGATLVRQLLTFARKAEVELQSVLVNEILNELAKLFEETFPKTIVVSLKLESSLPPVTADPNQLHQVFLNLCVNARDAMLPKGGTLSMSSRLIDAVAVQVKFPRASAIEYVLVDVRDTGTGMDESTKSRIFEPFFTTKQKGKGTGLGLAMVYGIVENHRGFIDVESTLGAGTTFHVYLPVQLREVKPIVFEAEREEEIPGGTETILLVEDEVMLRELAGTVLEGKGYKVLKAVDGEEAFEMYRRHADEIALVVSDLGLPKLTGEELFARIRELNTVAKVILASGYIEPELKSQLLKAGAKELIQKPYVPREILKKIREVLDMR